MHKITKKQNEKHLVRRPCISYLRECKNLNILKKYDALYWVCPPDHSKVAPQIARFLKLDGYEKGVYDLTIVAASADILKVWLIEFKIGKNDYTLEQRKISLDFLHTPVTTMKIYSLDEFILFVDENLR